MTSTSIPAAPDTDPTAVPASSTALLARAFEQTSSVLGALTPDDLTRPTPCPGWDVATIAEHVIGALDMFVEAAGGTAPATGTPADLVARFDEAAASALGAWSAPARMDTPVALPFGTFPAPLALLINVVETFVHTGDLAVATGNAGLIDDAFCDTVRRAAEDAGFDAFRQPGMFGPAVNITGGGSGLRGLLGFMGRTVA